MIKVTTSAAAAFVVLMATGIRADDGNDRKRAERTLHSLRERAERLPKPSSGDEIASFLAKDTERLMKRCRSMKTGSYEQRRILEALDDLLDARDDLIQARSPVSKEKDGPERGDTARRLERVYFRLQHGEYFAELSRDLQAAEYVRRSRQLYQLARSAYDRGEYLRASRLASAANELVNVLENLAQASVRHPDPPVLK